MNKGWAPPTTVSPSARRSTDHVEVCNKTLLILCRILMSYHREKNGFAKGLYLPDCRQGPFEYRHLRQSMIGQRVKDLGYDLLNDVPLQVRVYIALSRREYALLDPFALTVERSSLIHVSFSQIFLISSRLEARSQDGLTFNGAFYFYIYCVYHLTCRSGQQFQHI